MSRQALLLLPLLVAVTFALIPLEFEAPIPVPRGWSVVADEEATLHHPIEIIVALKQNPAGVRFLHNQFHEISDPKHPNYGKYYTHEQLTKMLAPSAETINTVERWLRSHGVDAFGWTYTLSQDFLTVTMPAALVAKLLHVRYQVFVHETGARYIGTLGPYFVPEEVAPHIDLIAGVVGLPKIKEPRILAEATAYDDEITPPVIRSRYNVTDGLINTIPNNSHAVAEFQGEFYDAGDLRSFFQKYVDTGKQFSRIDKTIGENEAGDPGIEAMLDVEFLMGVAPNATTWFISVAPMPFWSDLMKWVAILNNNTDIPYVHSISYGSQGDYPSTSYRDRLDTELQKIGSRGVSIIFASGDSGSGCDDECTFYPSYPATNLYVTAVGATRFIQGTTGDEAAVKSFLSGGGFSWHFDAPDYQKPFIERYFQNAKELPPAEAYRKTGRGNPDVAALGDEEFTVVINGGTQLVGGTSASAPVFAAIVTFLNQIRISQGKPTMGFLNPWLYQIADSNPDAFFDVTVGDNINSYCCYEGISGFDCARGWDPVTGLGTPNFEVMKTLV